VWRFIRFNTVSAVGFAIQLLTVAFLSRWLSVPAEAATGAAVAVAVIHNFLWHRHWTWADRTTPSVGAAAAFLHFAAANGTISFAGNLAIVTILVRTADMDVVTANVAAVALCGLLNYRIGDRVVFRGRTREPAITD
jgi:putative flippase GtrA